MILSLHVARTVALLPGLETCQLLATVDKLRCDVA